MGEAGCLDEDCALAYAEGALPEARRAAVEAHLDTCRDCRRLVSELARLAPAAGADLLSAALPSADLPSAETRPSLAKHEAFGRFVVLDIVGAGGMGVVYAAYDPKLDRKVAIKVLHRGSKTGIAGDDAELVAEGKAMAQVTHPNVVAVHDVGLNGELPFIAMEFVAGTSLRRWLGEERRDPDEILAVLIGAGRGLESAHAAGLVHRDFKPDNVLITADGRAKVTDFGLARRWDVHQGREISGTLAYMSPEQRRGEALDARSDQFSFAVTLYESLSGVRPDGPVTPDKPLRFAGAAKTIAPSVRRVLSRALAEDRSQRFESMGALLEELAGAEGRRRRRLAAVLFAGALAGLAGALAYRAHDERSRACALAADEVAAPWSGDVHARVHAHFDRATSPLARDVWPSVERALDHFTESLRSEQRAACEATRVRREATEETYALRASCLQRRRLELSAVVDALDEADDAVIENALTAVAKLTPVEACVSDAALVVQPLPPRDRATQGEVDRLRARLAKVKASLDTGRYRAGIADADACIADADRLAYGPLQAEAYYFQGALRDGLSQSQGAEDSLYRAAEHAELSRHDELAAKARTLLVWVVGYRQARYDAGHALEHAARAATLRAGARADLTASLENGVGTLLWAEGKYTLAGEHFERARSLWEKELGHDHPLVADAVNNRGLTSWNEGKLEVARELLQDALAVRTKLLGVAHPAVASSLNNLGLVAQDREEFAEAREHHRRAVSIQTGVHGAQHPLVASALNNLGLAELGLGQYDVGLSTLLRALAIRRATSPDSHPDIANSLVNVALAHLALNQLASARQALDEAIERQGHHLAPEHPAVVDTLLIEARLLRAEGRSEEAIGRAQRAGSLARRVLGPTHPLVAASAAEEGIALAALGRSADAIARLRPIVARAEALPDSLVVGTAALALARALAAEKGPRDEIGDALGLARRRLARAGPRGEKSLAALGAFDAAR